MELKLMHDPVLREPTAIVLELELDYVKSLIPEMIKIMNDEGGIGLAANQVGISKRFFIVKIGEEVKLIINPELIEQTDVRSFVEGCLSIPGAQAETQRAYSIRFKYRDENFNEVIADLSNLEAIAIQHEVDHLDGKLYTDDLPPVRKRMVLDKSKKFIKMKGCK